MSDIPEATARRNIDRQLGACGGRHVHESASDAFPVVPRRTFSSVDLQHARSNEIPPHVVVRATVANPRMGQRMEQ